MDFFPKANVLLFLISSPQYNFNDRGYLGFETITLVPIQTKLIDPSLMTAQEVCVLVGMVVVQSN